VEIDSTSRLRLVTAGYWISILALAVNSFAIIFEGNLPDSPTNFIAPMFLIIFFFSYLGLGRELKDERLSKIAGRAMTISWCATLLSAYALIAVSTAFYIRLNQTQVLGGVLLVMIVSMAVSNELLKWKGDIE
jgi:peptidoglycan/LPS O-acetylase OafA/YrhL